MTGYEGVTAGRLWVDVFDSSGDLINDTPLYPLSATVVENLSAIGSISISWAGTDYDARTASGDITSADSVVFDADPREVKIYHDGVLIGRGLVENVEVGEDAGGVTLKWSGRDRLGLLADVTCGMGLRVPSGSVPTPPGYFVMADAFDEIIDLAGWTANTVVVGYLIPTYTQGEFMRVDGASVYKALRNEVLRWGGILRQGDGDTVLDILKYSPFNDSALNSDLVALSPGTTRTGDNTDALLISTIRIKQQSNEITNWIIPVGEGTGDAALTLEPLYGKTGYADVYRQARPTGGYDYYVQDATSISAYGQRERVLKFNVGAVSNAEDEVEVAAAALKRAADTHLRDNKNPRVTYSLTVQPAPGADLSDIRAGNKLRVIYSGMVDTADGRLQYINVNELLYITRVQTYIGLEGVRLTLDVCNVAAVEETVVEKVASAIERVEVNGLAVQQSFVPVYVPFEAAVDTSNSASVLLPFDKAIYKITRAEMRLLTKPLEQVFTITSATLSGSTGSGGGFSGNVGSGGYTSGYTGSGGAGDAAHQHTFSVSAHTHSLTISNHSHSISLSYTPTVAFGISRDGTYPGSISVTVRGVPAATGLGTTGSAADETIDITDDIKAGNIQDDIAIGISAGAGRGVVYGMIKIYAVVTTVDIGI